MLLHLAITAALAQPPQATLDSLGAALTRLEDPAQVVSIRVLTTVTHTKPDGEDRTEERVVSAVTNGPDGREVTVLEHTRDGEPVTEEEPSRGGRMDLVLPGEAPRYRFGSTLTEGEVAVASFEPARGERTKDLTTGRLAWDPDSGRPLWLEFEPARGPLLVQSLTTRLELTATEPLHTTRIVSEGVGGVPGLRRWFRMDMTIEQVGWVP